MRTGLKVAVSLLIALVVFAAVVVFALPGLFGIVEGVFFQPRVQQRWLDRTGALVSSIDDRHRINIQRYQAVLKAQHVVPAFLSNQSHKTITARRQAFDHLHAQFPNLLFVRFVGAGGDAIHYSTLPTDIDRAVNFVQIYGVPLDLKDPLDPTALLTGHAAPVVLGDPERQRFLYSFPVTDQSSVFRGSALFYVAASDVADHLTRAHSMESRQLDLVTGGVVINSPQPSSSFIAAVERVWAAQHVPTITSLRMAADTAAPSETSEASDLALAADDHFVLFSRDGEFGRAGLIIPAKALTIPAAMRWTLLGAAAVTLFLLVFLILNLRQDPAVVLADRLNRFQITIPRQFLDQRAQLHWDEWRSKLALRKAEVKTWLTSGVRSSKRAAQDLDTLFDRSWDEIVGVLGSRADPAQGSAPSGTVDAVQFEQMVPGACAETIDTLPAAVAPNAEEGGPPIAPSSEPGVADGEAVEKIGEAQDVGALKELDDTEEVKAFHELGEAKPPLITGPGAPMEQSLNDPGEAEAVNDLSIDGDEGSQLEDLVELAPLEPLLSARPYEDLEELDQPEAFTRDVAAEAAENDPDLDDAEEVEELDEVKLAPVAASFLHRLRGGGKLLHFSLGELAAVVSEVRESVALEDGVYRIKPEILARTGRTKSFFRLAERARSRATGHWSVAGPQGIGDSSGGSDATDSLFGDDMAPGPADPDTLSRSRGTSREHRLPVSDGGIELDQLLRQYPRSNQARTLTRCLIDLSRPLKAVGTVLMEWRDDSYVATQTVGLMEGSAAGLQHAAGGDMYDLHLSNRHSVLLLESLEAIPNLAEAFVPADVDQVKRILYLPVRFRDADAYLLLASREAEKPWDLRLLVSKLALYPA